MKFFRIRQNRPQIAAIGTARLTSALPSHSLHASELELDMASIERRPTHIEVSTPAPGDGEEISETNAKQGRRGLHILTVLTVSLALVVVAFVAAFVMNSRPSLGARGQTASAERSQQFSAPETPPPTQRPAS
jgi:hypothetical protein